MELLLPGTIIALCSFIWSLQKQVSLAVWLTWKCNKCLHNPLLKEPRFNFLLGLLSVINQQMKQLHVCHSRISYKIRSWRWETRCSGSRVWFSVAHTWISTHWYDWFSPTCWLTESSWRSSGWPCLPFCGQTKGQLFSCFIKVTSCRLFKKKAWKSGELMGIISIS